MVGRSGFPWRSVARIVNKKLGYRAGIGKTGGVSAAALSLVLPLVLSLLLPVASTQAGDATDIAEEKIVAAYVYNFCKYVTWPADQAKSIQLGVLGGDGTELEIFQSLNGKTAGGLPLNVEGVEIPPVPLGFRVIYIPGCESEMVNGVLTALAGEPVLTVSRCDDFCKNGGMIGLVNVRGKIRFEVNKIAADAAGITISSQILKLAVEVIK